MASLALLEINEIVSKLNHELALDLPISNEHWSSDKSSKSDDEKCVEGIKFLYHANRSELDKLLEKYLLQVQPVPHSDRVPYLLRLLKETVGTHSRSSSARLRDEKAKTPIASLNFIHQPARSGTPPVFETDNGTVDSTFESGDEDEFESAPQSPTLDAIDSANRRRERQRDAEQASGRKRQSDHDAAPPPFESQSSANTEECTSIASTIPATMRDGVTTADTSFTSLGGPVASHNHKDSASESLDYSPVGSDALHSVRQRYDFALDQNLSSSDSLSWDSEMENEVINVAKNYEASIETPPSRIQRIRPEHSPQNGQNLIFPAQQSLFNDIVVAEHHQVRDLPKYGLFVEDKPLSSHRHSHLPFRVRYECARVALSNGLPINELLPDPSKSIQNYDAMWMHFAHPSRNPSIKLPPKGSAMAWAAAKDKFENVYFGGRLAFNTKSNGPIFTFSLDPMELDNSCRFHRAFGGDRFFYLLIPRMTLVPSHLQGQKPHLRKRIVEWLLAEKVFLGRHWRAVYIEEAKRRGKKGKDYSHRVVLFATEGLDIRPEIMTPIAGTLGEYSSQPRTSIEQLLNWFMPLEKNKHQPYCKAFTRISLGFSRTTPTIVFRPDQVRWVPDVLADGSPESTLYDDPDLDWGESRNPPDEKVMNDGCARISLGACQLIWQRLGRSGPIPSAFQARINGAKGVWIRSGPMDSTFANDNEVWIEISNSQRKFFPHDEDTPQSFDSNRWTFEVVKYTQKLRSAALHLAFVPILLNRGVHLEDMQKLVVGALNNEKDDLLSAAKDPIKLRAWINQRYSCVEDYERMGGIRWQASLPFSLAEKIILLLESGFHPMRLSYLGQLTRWFAEKFFTKVKSSLSVRVGRSTNAIGIADPIGILKPGEVHLAFSENFVQEAWGESLPFLNNVEVIVARHPALRRSDVQKMRAVYKTELSHLLDVVVFPSRGCIPLASKLQGGDYDGDVFWICWDSALVHNFMNAPAIALPAAETYGIHVDERILQDIATTPRQFIDNFLAESFAFAYRSNLLGIVTLFHEKLAYAENSIYCPGVNMIADLHGYLIDATKSGYKFDEQDFESLKASSPFIRKKNLSTPAYKLGINLGYDAKPEVHRRRLMKLQSEPPKSYNPNHVVDRLFFTVVEPHLQTTLDILKQDIEEQANDWDEDLIFPYMQEHAEAEAEADDIVRAELRSLKQSLESIYQHWITNLRGDKADEPFPEDHNLRNTVLNDCYKMFTELQPQNPQHRIIARWTRERIGQGPSRWTLIKASALFMLFHAKQKFPFHLAGKELAYIKAQSKPGSRMLVEPVWAQMKPRRIKKPTEQGPAGEIEFTALFGLQPDLTFQVPPDDGEDESDQDDFYDTMGDWTAAGIE